MPVAITDPPVQSDIPRKLWTRSEYEALSSSGLFAATKLELVEGELVNKMGKNWPHVNSQMLLLTWLVGVFESGCVALEGPIDVAPEDNPSSEPQPDLIVLARDRSQLRNSNPRPEEIHILIEVADSSVGFDLRTKAALYARAGIVEYWVLDIGGRRIIVHRDPRGGRYASVVAYSADETLSPLAAPNAFLRVKDVLPE